MLKKFILNWEYYSSFTKLTRHLAWINWSNWKRGLSSKKNFNYLKFKDIQDSRALLFHLAQHESYMKEIFWLSSKQTVDKNSTILSLTPFLDENHYFCVGGCLKHANIPTNSKNQIILPKDHYLSRFFYKKTHEQNVHVGREHTRSLLRKHFWIAAWRGLIKNILSDCIYCRRQFVKPEAPSMGTYQKKEFMTM